MEYEDHIEHEVTDTQRICLVITTDDISEEDIRRRLGDSLPLHFVSWADQAYLQAIAALSPRVIVVTEHTVDAARLMASLLAEILGTTEPTIASLGLFDLWEGADCLYVCKVGADAAVRIGSLADVSLYDSTP